MKFRWEKKYLYWGITGFSVITISILFFMLLNNIKEISGALNIILGILAPFIMAFCFAYVLNPAVKLFEKLFTRLLNKIAPKKAMPKLIRGFSVGAAILLAVLVVVGLIVMLIPQVARSIVGVVNSLPDYLETFEQWVFRLIADDPNVGGIVTNVFDTINEMLISWTEESLLPQVQSIVSGITVGVIGIVNVVKNLFVSIILTIYVLYSKEKFLAQTKKITYTIFNIKHANKILKVTREANKVFGGFIIGKIIDSAIIGVICFVGMNLFNWISPIDMPYVLLISVVIAVTNIIPFFGPFIGAIPCGLLILIVNPIAAIYFVIFILLLQQFDGNILGPKILGDSTGLSAFWVLFAILAGGGLFGFMGMLLGVPTFAVIYTLIKEGIESKLKKHEMPVDTSVYYALEYMDAKTESPIMTDDKEDADIKIADVEKRGNNKDDGKKL